MHAKYRPITNCDRLLRTLRHTLQSLRPIMDIIVILFLVIAVFSLLGFYLFSPFPNNQVITHLKSVDRYIEPAFISSSFSSRMEILSPTCSSSFQTDSELKFMIV